MDHPPVWGDRTTTLADLAVTTELYSTLVDVRFKLLTFVPAITALAVGIVTLNGGVGNDASWLIVGMIGLVATIAIVVYEIRNSLIHDRAIHRIKHLERVLGFRPSLPAGAPGGMFSERSKSDPLLGMFRVQHDRALAMIYGIVAGAWTWVVARGVAIRWDSGWIGGDSAMVARIALPVVVALLVAEEIARLGTRGRPPGLIYTLSDIIPKPTADGATTGEVGDVSTSSDDARSAAGALYGDLVRTHSVLPHAKDRKFSSYCWRLDIKKCGAARAEELMVAAYALKLVEDRPVRWFWIWSPLHKSLERALPDKCHKADPKAHTKANRRKRSDKRATQKRLLVWQRAEHPNWIEAICQGIYGAPEVWASVAKGESMEMLHERLELRDGSGAPWASHRELRLREELLKAARPRNHDPTET